jgi:hypothetical protein
MVGGIHVYGGFHLTPRLAARVWDAVREITQQQVDPVLSHVDDESCGLCRAARTREAGDDASEPGRAGRQWTA